MTFCLAGVLQLHIKKEKTLVSKYGKTERNEKECLHAQEDSLHP